MRKQFTFEVIGEITFDDSFDWQAQADEWWNGDLDELQKSLALFMIGDHGQPDRFEGADLPHTAAIDGGIDWVIEHVMEVPAS